MHFGGVCCEKVNLTNAPTRVDQLNERKKDMFTSIFQETMAEENWTKFQNTALKTTALLFPLGVIEEHGPHLPLGSDIYFGKNWLK